MTPQQKFAAKQRAERLAAGGFEQTFKFLGKTYTLPTRFPKKDIPTLKKFLKSLEEWRKGGGNFESYINLPSRKKSMKLAKARGLKTSTFDNAEGGIWRRFVQYAKGNAPVNPGRGGTGELYKIFFDQIKTPKKELNVIKDLDYENIQKFKQGKITEIRAQTNVGDTVMADIVEFTNKNPNATKEQFLKAFKSIGGTKDIAKKVSTTFKGAIRNRARIAAGEKLGPNQEKIFREFSDEQLNNFARVATRLFPKDLQRTFQQTILEVYENNPIKQKQALKKLKEFNEASSAIAKQFKLGEGPLKGLGKAPFQLDHPISFSVLRDTGDLSKALRTNPIAGDVNQFKAILDKRLVTLRNRIEKGVNVDANQTAVKSLQNINKKLFGNLAGDFDIKSSGKLKVRDYGAKDFLDKSFNPLADLQKNLGLGKDIRDLKLSTNLYNDLEKAGVNVDRFDKLRSLLNPLDQKEITKYAIEWSQKNPDNSLAVDFLKGMSKNPVGKRILSRLGPLAILAVAAPLISGFMPSSVQAAETQSVVKQPQFSEPLKYDATQGSIVNANTDQKADQNQILEYIKENPLKVTAGSSLGFAAQEVPGAYKAARDLGRGRIRSTLGISGAIRPVLTTFGTPLLTGLYEGAIGAKRLEEGETMTDILTDPLGPALGVSLMEPLSKLSGVVKGAKPTGIMGGITQALNPLNFGNVGTARPGLTSKILRMGLSPMGIRALSKGGLYGVLALSALAGYDQYNKYQNEEGMIYNFLND